MPKKKIAMLVMVDGALWDEQYLEYESTCHEEWTSTDESAVDQAQWFFY